MALNKIGLQLIALWRAGACYSLTWESSTSPSQQEWEDGICDWSEDRVVQFETLRLGLRLSLWDWHWGILYLVGILTREMSRGIQNFLPWQVALTCVELLCSLHLIGTDWFFLCTPSSAWVRLGMAGKSCKFIAHKFVWLDAWDNHELSSNQLLGGVIVDYIGILSSSMLAQQLGIHVSTFGRTSPIPSVTSISSIVIYYIIHSEPHLRPAQNHELNFKLSDT